MTCLLPSKHGKANWAKHFFQISFAHSVSTIEELSIDINAPFFFSMVLSATLSCALTLYLGNRTRPKYCPRSKSSRSSAAGNALITTIVVLYCYDYPLNDPWPPFLFGLSPKLRTEFPSLNGVRVLLLL